MSITQLAALFRRLRKQFGGRVSNAALVLVSTRCGPSGKCGRRDVAWAVPANNTVYLLERALRLTNAQLQGLMLHELGHLADPVIDLPGREKRADAIAYAITGKRIRYGRSAIQTTGRGSPTRPARLHQ